MAFGCPGLYPSLATPSGLVTLHIYIPSHTEVYRGDETCSTSISGKQAARIEKGPQKQCPRSPQYKAAVSLSSGCITAGCWAMPQPRVTALRRTSQAAPPRAPASRKLYQITSSPSPMSDLHPSALLHCGSQTNPSR